MPSWKKVILSGSDAALNSLNVTTAFTASGLNYPTIDNGEESFLQTNGSGNLSFQYVKTIYEEIYNGEATTIVKGTPVYVSGSVGAAGRVFRADAGNPTKMPVIYISADNIASAQVGRGIALGLITGVNTTGYPAGTEIYVAVGGGWTSTRPTGSAIVQTLGYVTKEGNGGQGVILNPGPNSLPNLTSGSVWVGNSSSIPTAVTTSSLSVASASFASTASVTLSGSSIVGGTGSNGQVAFWDGENSQSGDNGLFWDNTNKRLQIFNPSEGNLIAPLIVRNTIPYQSPFTQFIQFWQVGSGSNVMSLRADGSLDTIGNIRANTLRLNGNGTNNTNFNMLGRNGQDGTGINFLSGHIIGITTNSVERMRILSTGELTIGSTTAGARLDVRAQGALSTDIAFRVRNSADTANIVEVRGDGIITLGPTGIATGNTTLNVRGNIVANSNSSARVTVGTDASNWGIVEGFGNGLELRTVNSVSTANGRVFINPQTNSNIINTVRGTGVQIWNTGGSERMRITETGNVGIGTTSPNAKLDVQGTLIVSSSILQYSNNASITSGSTANVASFSTGSYTAGFFDYVATSGTNARAGTVFTVWNANNVEFTETSTNDIGSTSNLILSASLSAGAIQLQATSLTGTWSVKTLARMI